MTDFPVALIVAVADNQVIGHRNALPWHLPQDLAHFKRQTLGKPILMGRKTFESIGRPLPGRSNIVITRDRDFESEGIRVVHSLEDAIALAEDIALIDGAEELVVIGGAQIYNDALELAQRIYLTRVHVSPVGDAYFPELGEGQWREVMHDFHAQEGDKPAHTFLEYTRADA
ncbi:MAG: dihydrofolate reductase [Pseudomonadota bacterium]